jgi:hypothetical protein
MGTKDRGHAPVFERATFQTRVSGYKATVSCSLRTDTLRHSCDRIDASSRAMLHGNCHCLSSLRNEIRMQLANGRRISHSTSASSSPGITQHKCPFIPRDQKAQVPLSPPGSGSTKSLHPSGSDGTRAPSSPGIRWHKSRFIPQDQTAQLPLHPQGSGSTRVPSSPGIRRHKNPFIPRDQMTQVPLHPPGLDSTIVPSYSRIRQHKSPFIPRDQMIQVPLHLPGSDSTIAPSSSGIRRHICPSIPQDTAFFPLKVTMASG